MQYTAEQYTAVAHVCSERVQYTNAVLCTCSAGAAPPAPLCSSFAGLVCLEHVVRAHASTVNHDALQCMRSTTYWVVPPSFVALACQEHVFGFSMCLQCTTGVWVCSLYCIAMAAAGQRPQKVQATTLPQCASSVCCHPHDLAISTVTGLYPTLTVICQGLCCLFSGGGGC